MMIYTSENGNVISYNNKYSKNIFNLMLAEKNWNVQPGPEKLYFIGEKKECNSAFEEESNSRKMRKKKKKN